MPKILIVIARLNVGGTSQYIGELVPGLQKSGYEVIVATGRVQGAEIEDPIVTRLPIERIRFLGRRISIYKDVRARREIANLISKYRPDIIYSHTFKAGLLVRSLNTSISRIHAFHGHLLTEPELAGWKSRLVILVERYLATRTDLLVTVGERVALELLHEGVGVKEQYRSIPPGVHLLELEDRSKARKQLGIESETRPIVVWMARVTAVKAPLRVVELAKAIPEARFLLAGGGDLIDEVQKKAPANLTVLGWQPASRMWAVADIAISTSENEGMPVALIEAQLAGIPVVAVDVGSVGEVIENNVTGFAYSNFNSEYFLKVKDLVLDKRIRKILGIQARERAKIEFSPATMVQRHLQVFLKLL